VARTAGAWVIGGQRNRVTLNQADLAVAVQAGPVIWRMAPSAKDDLLVRSRGEEFLLRLSDAGKIQIEPYDTGFKTGVKITLEQFHHAGQLKGGVPIDLRLYLTVCLEGKDEDLVFDTSAAENETVVRQLDWPKELDPRDVFDHTVLSNRWGTLLPRNWKSEYSPVRTVRDGKIDPTDTSIVESNLIE
jgi:hypothetical protein